MPATTTTGLPYPLPTDPPDGAAQIKALAEAIDAAAAQRHGTITGTTESGGQLRLKTPVKAAAAVGTWWGNNDPGYNVVVGWIIDDATGPGSEIGFVVRRGDTGAIAPALTNAKVCYVWWPGSASGVPLAPATLPAPPPDEPATLPADGAA